MDDFSSIPGGVSSVLGAAAGLIGAAVLWLRRFLSKDSVDRSADAGYRLLIEDLRMQVQIERARNTELRESRDAAIAQIDALREQVSNLSDQVTRLQRQIAGMKPGLPL